MYAVSFILSDWFFVFSCLDSYDWFICFQLVCAKMKPILVSDEAVSLTILYFGVVLKRDMNHQIQQVLEFIVVYLILLIDADLLP